jgi:hypothetical protein
MRTLKALDMLEVFVRDFVCTEVDTNRCFWTWFPDVISTFLDYLWC